MEKLQELFIFLSMYLLGMTANLQAYYSNGPGYSEELREWEDIFKHERKTVHYHNVNYHAKHQTTHLPLQKQ